MNIPYSLVKYNCPESPTSLVGIIRDFFYGACRREAQLIRFCLLRLTSALALLSQWGLLGFLCRDWKSEILAIFRFYYRSFLQTFINSIFFPCNMHWGCSFYLCLRKSLLWKWYQVYIHMDVFSIVKIFFHQKIRKMKICSAKIDIYW